MITATSSITIRRPPEAVFSMVGDPERDREWNRHAVSVSKLSAGPAARGARYRGTYKGFGACELELAAYDPPHVATVAGTNKQGSFQYSYIIEPAGDGATLRMEAQFSPRGVTRLMAPLMRAMLAGRVKELSVAVKQRLEGAGQPVASRRQGESNA